MKNNYKTTKKGYKGKPQSRRNGSSRETNDVKFDRSRKSMKEEQEDVRKAVPNFRSYNDISWYSHNPQMLKDAASFSFNAPLGNQLPANSMFNAPTGSVTIDWNQSDSVPGLYVLWYMPCIGVSNTSTSPANLAAQNIYSYVRYMNSGAKNYDQADLMLYLLAMDSIYIAWNWVKRIYGYARTYNPLNRYMPRVYAAADGIDFDDLIANLADYRMMLNSMASRISSFCVPAVMPLFIRHSWLTSNIYMDSDNNKAQQYMLRPSSLYKYSETTSKYGGELIPQAMTSSTPQKLGDIITNVITPLLDAIAYSEDIGVMSGDILKAYGQERLFKVTPVEPDYIVEPVYNEEVLNQIHNSTLVPGLTNNNMVISQNPDTGYLVWDPVLTTGPRISRDAVLFNVPWDNPTPENVMLGTRLSTTIYNDGTNWRLGSVGSEVISHRMIYRMQSSGNFVVTAIPEYLVFSNTTTATSNDRLAVENQALLISNFDWHPLMPTWHVTGTAGTSETWRFEGWLGDITNYTVINAYDLRQLHEVALISEFNVPQLGSF